MSSINGISAYSSKNRLTGFTGFDTEGTVQKLMTVERVPLTKLYQKRQLVEWKQEKYRETINSLKDLKDTYFDLLKPQTDMMSSNNYKKHVANSSNTNVVTVSNVTTTYDVTHNITVVSTAKSATNVSSAAIGVPGITLNSTLGDIGVFDGQISINGKQVSYSSTDTINSFINKVNKSDLGITIDYLTFSDKFIITSKTTGNTSNAAINDTGNFLFAAKLSGNIAGGADAVFNMDGVMGLTSPTNTLTMNGATYTLLQPGNANVDLKLDVDAVYNNISNFISKYNEVLSKINLTLSEKYEREYQPLTDEQKKEMKDEDIKAWEKKAKTGLLSNDRMLRDIADNMRRSFFEPIDGVNLTMSSIGISTKSYKDKGILTIDENKLKSAIQNNPDGVMQLFSQKPPYTSNTDLNAVQRKDRYSKGGVAYRIYDIVQDNIRTNIDSFGKMGLLLEKAGLTGTVSEFTSMLSEEISDYTKKIEDLKDKLIDKENRYYKKFSALETAIQKMSNQSGWLASQLGGQG